MAGCDGADQFPGHQSGSDQAGSGHPRAASFLTPCLSRLRHGAAPANARPGAGCVRHRARSGFGPDAAQSDAGGTHEPGHHWALRRVCARKARPCPRPRRYDHRLLRRTGGILCPCSRRARRGGVANGKPGGTLARGSQSGAGFPVGRAALCAHGAGEGESSAGRRSRRVRAGHRQRGCEPATQRANRAPNRPSARELRGGLCQDMSGRADAGNAVPRGPFCLSGAPEPECRRISSTNPRRRTSVQRPSD